MERELETRWRCRAQLDAETPWEAPAGPLGVPLQEQEEQDGVPGMSMSLTGSEGGDGCLGGGAGPDIRRSLDVHRLVDVLVHLPDRPQLCYPKKKTSSQRFPVSYLPNLCCTDPDPYPYVFGPPGSLVRGSGSGSFYHQVKIVRKT
jgi:hypothetical protein